MDGGDRVTVVQTGLASSNLRKSLPRQAVCEVTAGKSRGAKVAFGARPIIVGAGAGCDLHLDDERVSRQHLELTLAGDVFRVRDLGSTNGTFLQGARITEILAPAGSILRVGDSTLRLSAVASPKVALSADSHFGGLLGGSAVMREIFSIFTLASPTTATILIEGESGTGKEVAARAIHEKSERASKPFVVVDCSAISESLFDSHLFGHKKGAFTGAIEERKGALVKADGGTIFLDEIGELPAAAQARLLRVLEERTLQPVGSDTRISVDVRVVAATHRDLAAMVSRNEFRFDLFQRLALVHVRMPSLKERLEDIPLLVRNFYESRSLSPGAIDGPNLAVLQSYAWPGNVRELRNALERSFLLSAQPQSGFASLTINLAAAPRVESNDGAWLGDVTALPFHEAKEKIVEAFERRYLADMWARCEYNVSRAAEAAGLSRRHYRELLDKHGIEKP